MEPTSRPAQSAVHVCRIDHPKAMWLNNERRLLGVITLARRTLMKDSLHRSCQIYYLGLLTFCIEDCDRVENYRTVAEEVYQAAVRESDEPVQRYWEGLRARLKKHEEELDAQSDSEDDGDDEDELDQHRVLRLEHDIDDIVIRYVRSTCTAPVQDTEEIGYFREFLTVKGRLEDYDDLPMVIMRIRSQLMNASLPRVLRIYYCLAVANWSSNARRIEAYSAIAEEIWKVAKDVGDPSDEASVMKGIGPEIWAELWAELEEIIDRLRNILPERLEYFKDGEDRCLKGIANGGDLEAIIDDSVIRFLRSTCQVKLSEGQDDDDSTAELTPDSSIDGSLPDLDGSTSPEISFSAVSLHGVLPAEKIEHKLATVGTTEVPLSGNASSAEKARGIDLGVKVAERRSDLGVSGSTSATTSADQKGVCLGTKMAQDDDQAEEDLDYSGLLNALEEEHQKVRQAIQQAKNDRRKRRAGKDCKEGEACVRMKGDANARANQTEKSRVPDPDIDSGLAKPEKPSGTDSEQRAEMEHLKAAFAASKAEAQALRAAVKATLMRARRDLVRLRQDREAFGRQLELDLDSHRMHIVAIQTRIEEHKRASAAVADEEAVELKLIEDKLAALSCDEHQQRASAY